MGFNPTKLLNRLRLKYVIQIYSNRLKLHIGYGFWWPKPNTYIPTSRYQLNSGFWIMQ